MAAPLIAAGILQASQSYFGTKAAASQYKVEQYKYETDAKIAKMNSKNVALQLSRDFNNTMASNAVIAAAQGRSGATAEAVGRAAETQYNWDINFAELSRDIQSRGLESMALSAKTAAKTTAKAAIPNLVGSAAMSYLQYKMIK